MASNAARNVVQAIMRHTPRSSLPGDGNTVHLKNFAFSSQGARASVVQVAPDLETNRAPREYFLRPKYDSQMANPRDKRLGYLPGHYRAYAFEVSPNPTLVTRRGA